MSGFVTRDYGLNRRRKFKKPNKQAVKTTIFVAPDRKKQE
jgi:hypothetical protein